MKKYIFSIVSAVFMLFVITTSAQAATYYVAKTGSNSNTCAQAQNQSTPKLTVGAGAACLSAGDTLYIKAGTYSEPQNSINLPAASSWVGATTVSNFGSDVVVFQSVGNPFHTFNSTAAYVIFNGLILDGINDGWADGMAIGQGPHHIRLQNSEMKNFGSSGWHPNADAPGCEIINTKIHDGGTTDFDNAIYAGNTDGIIDHVEIYHWAGAAIQMYNGGNMTVNNWRITNNIIHDTSGGVRGSPNTNTGGYTNGFRTQGIVLYNGSGNLVYNNLVYNLRLGSGGSQGGIDVGGSAFNNKVYNNTVYNDGIGILISSGAGTGNLIKNNIAFGNASGDIINSASGNTLSNNLITNPLFVSPSTNDFHLQSTSLAINTGATLAEVPTDFDGVSRPQGSAYDIGAYEYVSTAPDTTSPLAPTGLSATAISSSQINLSWTASIDPTVAGQVTSGVTGYRVERCQGSTCTTFSQIATPTGTTYNDTILTANTTYRYRVRAVDAALNLSAYSSIVNGTTQAASGNTYYVATTGNNANPGTITQPFQTIVKGVSVLHAGDTLYVRGGTYAEQLFEVNFGGSGTSWSTPITVAAFSGETVVLRPVTSQGNVARFANGSVSYVILDHLIFDGINAGGGSGASVMYCGPGSNHIRMTGGELRNGDGGGTLCEGDGHQWIGVHNHHNGRVSVSGGGANGYYNQGTTNALIEGGEIDNNVCYGVRFFNSAPSPTADNNIARNINIHNNGFGRGMNGTSQCASGGGGIILGNNNNIAYNNLVYENYWGINVNLGHPYSALKFYNNTIYNNDYGVDLGSGDSTILVRNNIVYSNSGVGINNPGGSAILSNNLTTDPKFVNAATNDFYLQSTSPAINTGATLAEVPTDFDGVSRPQGSAYDIGAYEFVSGGTPAPVVTISASPSTITSGQSSTITWSSTNATSCTASNAWTGAKATAGSQVVSPTLTSTYTLACTGTGGTDTKSTTVTVSPPSSTGPIAWYKFDEGTGTTASDSSGNTLTGSIANATWTTDRGGNIGKALSFNGTNSSVTIADSNILDLTSAFTVSAWVNPASTYTDFRTILIKNYVYYLYGSVSGYCGAGGTLAGFDVGTVCHATQLPANTWTLVTATYNGSSLILYKNGVQVASTPLTGAITTSTGTLQIGASQFGEYFTGKIDDARVYNRALTAAEVQSVYNEPVTSTGPIAWYKFDEGTGTTASDSSGTNTGTLLNGATTCANTSGCPTWSPSGGRIGGALSLDGIDDAVRVTGLLGNSPNITLAGWANLTSSDVSGSEVISLGDSVAIRLQSSNTNNAAGFYYDGTAWNSTAYPFTASGTGWHHIAYVVNDTANTQTLYIDGTARTTTNYTPSISYTLGANTFVGRHGNGNSNFDFKGLLDDVRVYNRALNATEVQSIYNEASAASVSSLTITPALEGRSSPLPSGIVFTVSFLTPGTNIIITSMSLTTNASGQLVPTASQLVSLQQGTYDIRTASQYYLSRKMFNQVLTSANTLTSPALYAGDFTNDSTVNNFDWSVMATNWFTSFTTTDINKDSITNSVDYSYINRNWNRVGE